MERKPITAERINNDKPINSKLTVLHIIIKSKKKIAVCKCECGTIKDFWYAHVLRGNTLSCGCYKRYLASIKYKDVDAINAKRHPKSLLTAYGFSRSRWGRGYDVMCTCECGGNIAVKSAYLMSGRIITCGCRTKPNDPFSRENNRKIHNSWQCMMNRCYRVRDVAYHRYGGRGVKVCEEWKNDYRKFVKWSLDNGWREGLQLDKDILGNGMFYSPETCKWATPQENMRYKRNSKRYIFNGQNLTIPEIADLINIPKERLYKRVAIGIADERIFYNGKLSTANKK